MLWTLVILVSAQDYVPVDGPQYTEFRKLPENVNPAFLAPNALTPVDLPREPTEVLISIGESANRVSYWYMPDDTIGDVFRYIAERTHLAVADIQSLRQVQYNAIGKAYTDIAYSPSTKLRDAKIKTGDELQVDFRSNVNTDNVMVTPNPAGSTPDDLPGFYMAKVKLAGMKMFAVPVPRLATGSTLRGIVEDRAALTQFSVDLRRNTRDGTAVLNGDTLVDKDNFFWATLTEKQNDTPAVKDDCQSGQVRVLTSMGRAHFLTFNCKTTAHDVQTSMENLGLLPNSKESPYGVIISVKGFYHTENMDTMNPDDLLVDHGVQNDGVVFVTIACPTTTVYFVYRDKSLPQILNCTTTIAYLAPIFNALSGHNDSVMPVFRYIDRELKQKQLLTNIPVMQQLKGITRLIVEIDYPACGDDGEISPSPSPSVQTVPWDAEMERVAPAPQNAIKLGDGTLLQHPSAWSKEELSKHRRRLLE